MSASAVPQAEFDERVFYESFRVSPIGIAIESMEGQPVFVNPSLCSMLGFSEAELLNKHCVDFSPAEDAEKDWALFQKLRAGQITNYQIEKRYFRRDGSLMWGRLSIALLGAGPSSQILAMVEDITEKKKGEESLRDSEERLRLAQQAARMGTFEWNIQTGVNIWTPELESIYGLPLGGFTRTQLAFEKLVHPDDRSTVAELVEEALKTGLPTRGEWRVPLSDGSLHWIVGRWQVFRDDSGQPERMIGVHLDVTERKLAERALADMTRKLIDAQEQERARIGRDLHDDVSQRLALLSVQLEQLKEHSPELQDRLEELRQQVDELSSDVQTLSHELHTSKLEHLGVVAGIRSWCREFAQRQRMEIDFKSDVATALPMEVGICLLRVLQESLHNAVKHSGVKHMQVQLRGDANQVHLEITDSGKGFDDQAAMAGKGLGLTSMRERVRLLNGTMAIDSRPMAGTRIHVRVPLKAEPNSEQAAG